MVKMSCEIYRIILFTYFLCTKLFFFLLISDGVSCVGNYTHQRCCVYFLHFYCKCLVRVSLRLRQCSSILGLSLQTKTRMYSFLHCLQATRSWIIAFFISHSLCVAYNLPHSLLFICYRYFLIHSVLHSFTRSVCHSTNAILSLLLFWFNKQFLIQSITCPVYN